MSIEQEGQTILEAPVEELRVEEARIEFAAGKNLNYECDAHEQQGRCQSLQAAPYVTGDARVGRMDRQKAMPSNLHGENRSSLKEACLGIGVVAARKQEVARTTLEKQGCGTQYRQATLEKVERQ